MTRAIGVRSVTVNLKTPRQIGVGIAVDVIYAVSAVFLLVRMALVLHGSEQALSVGAWILAAGALLNGLMDVASKVADRRAARYLLHRLGAS